MSNLPFTQFFAEVWLELLFVAAFQAIVVYASRQLEKKYSEQSAVKLLTAMSIVMSFLLLPVAYVMMWEAENVQHHIAESTTQIQSQIKSLEKSVELNVLSSKIESAFSRIASANPDELKQAGKIYADALDRLNRLAVGRLLIDNETDYFRVLREELDHVPNGGTVLDVVMPLNPDRLDQKTGRKVLKQYLQEIGKATRTRNLTYRLLIMPSQNIESYQALNRLVELGIEVWVVDRKELPEALRENFSIYPANLTVCLADRGDDAAIKGGIRIRNDPLEFARLQQKYEKIKMYCEDKPYKGPQDTPATIKEE